MGLFSKLFRNAEREVKAKRKDIERDAKRLVNTMLEQADSLSIPDMDDLLVGLIGKRLPYMQALPTALIEAASSLFMKGGKR